jgi:hypothetical protein
MKKGFYCIIASAKLQSRLAWKCVCMCTCLKGTSGGSATWCVQSDLLPSGFWTTALVRSHVDQLISWSEHSIACSPAAWAQGCSTCMTCPPEEGSHETWGTCHNTYVCVGETYFFYIQPKHEESTSHYRSRLFEWFCF